MSFTTVSLFARMDESVSSTHKSVISRWIVTMGLMRRCVQIVLNALQVTHQHTFLSHVSVIVISTAGTFLMNAMMSAHDES